MALGTKPHLFGLAHSNRDFTIRDTWGKNQFNSSFPAALCCFLHSLGENANYLKIQDGKFQCCELSITQAFGISPLDEDTYFAFESLHSPYQPYVIGLLPRANLVIQRRSTGECLAGLEVKLTALPDNTTCQLEDSQYGSEIVVRPDTIVYLACSLVRGLSTDLHGFIDNEIEIEDWTEARQVLPYVPRIIASLKQIVHNAELHQSPFLLQPIWKTAGKSPRLADDCLDVFFWSDVGFTHFLSEVANNDPQANKITRQTRTAIWLYKMLLDVTEKGSFDHARIIDRRSYNTKNDKAFASSGSITNKFMRCDRLISPRVKKFQIKEIILGGGQELLSPERRFDAIVYNSPELFDL